MVKTKVQHILQWTAVAAIIVGVPYGIFLWLERGGMTTLLILFAVAFVAGFVSDHRLAMVVASATIWVASAVDAWLRANPYSEPWQDWLPWNILFTEDAFSTLIVVIVPIGVFALLGWFCRVGVNLAIQGGVREVSRAVAEKMNSTPTNFPISLALVIVFLCLLTPPLAGEFAIAIAMLLLAGGLALVLGSSMSASKASGAILLLGGSGVITVLLAMYWPVISSAAGV